MKATVLLPFLWQFYASSVIENEDVDAASLIGQLANLTRNTDNETCHKFVQTLEKVVNSSDRLDLHDLDLISTHCTFITTSRNAPLPYFWESISRSLCFDFFTFIYSSINEKLEVLKDANIKLGEEVKNFFQLIDLLPPDFRLAVHGSKLIKLVDILFDRLEEEEDENSQKEIRAQIENLSVTSEYVDHSEAYLFRLYECIPVFRSIKSARSKGNINSEIISSEIEQLLSKAKDAPHYAMVLKTITKFYSRDENSDFYSSSFASNIDPEGHILEKFKEKEKEFIHRGSHIDATLFTSLSINMKIYLPQFYEYLANSPQPPNELLKLLAYNSTGRVFLDPKEEKLALAAKLPKNITPEEFKEFGPEEKKLLLTDRSGILLCHRIDASLLFEMDDDELRQVSTDCLASIKRFGGENAIDMSSIVPKLSDTVFEYSFQMHPKTFLAMTLAQANNYARKNSAAIGIIPIESITEKHFLKALSRNMIVNTMRSNPRIFHDEKLPVLYEFLDENSRENYGICSLLNMKDFFETLIDGVEDENNKLKCVQNIPPSCWKIMSGIFDKATLLASDISQILPYMDSGLFSNARGNIHENTMRALTPNLAANFGIDVNPQALKGINFCVIENSEALNSIPLKHLLQSLSTYPKCLPRVADEIVLQLFQKYTSIFCFLSYEFIKNHLGMDTFSKKSFSCLKNVAGIWKHMSDIYPYLAPDFFQDADIPPKKEYLDSHEDAAPNWALNNPQICSRIQEDLPIDYAYRLPIECQLNFFSVPRNYRKIIFDTTREELFEMLADRGMLKHLCWNQILQLPMSLRKNITIDLIRNIDDYEGVILGEETLEGFPDDIFALINKPLPKAVLEKLEPRFLSRRLCLFHFADELPEGAKRIDDCAHLLSIIGRNFINRDFFRDGLFSGLAILYSSDNFVSMGQLDSLQNLDRGLQDVFVRSEYHDELYEYLFEVINTFDLIDEETRLIKINKYRGLNLRVIYNLLITTKAHVIPSVQNYLMKYNGSATRLPLYFQAHVSVDGTIYPKYLYDQIILHAIYLAGMHTRIYFQEKDMDAGGLSRAFVEQCNDFIFNGPSEEKYREEIQDQATPFFLNPLMVKSEDKPAFFPYRAHRDIGKFVAYTIVKALQSETYPGIELDAKFYKMLRIAKPEQAENGIEGLTEADKAALNAYHESMFGVFSASSIIQNVLEPMYLDDEWFPRRTHFYTPFGRSVETNIADEGMHNEIVHEQIENEELFELYKEEYLELTYAEFRALMWNFKQVLMSAFDTDRLLNLWNLELWTSLLGKLELTVTADKIYDALNKEKNIQIDSLVLVRKSDSREVRKIGFNEAFKMLLDHLSGPQLEHIVAMFAGTPRIVLTENIFNFIFSYKEATFTVAGSSAFQGEMLTREDLNQIIEKIYQEQIEMFGLDPLECEMVEAGFFPRLYPHTCFKNIEVSSQMNNFQFLFAITQQINSPPNAMEG